MILSTDEALRQVWDHKGNKETSLVLAIEVIELRERIEKMRENEVTMMGLINRLHDELAAIL